MKKASILLAILSGIVLYCCTNEVTETKKTAALKEPTSVEELGELLFFDPILSGDSSVSCASCHKPQFAFSDNVPFSFGVDSLLGGRNTPSAMNLSDRSFFFHDGRAESLEAQAKAQLKIRLK